MITPKKIANVSLIALFVLMIILLLWKWRTNILMHEPDNEKIVAKINDYVVYISDFQTAIKPPLSNEDIASNSKQTKEKILNDLILNKALVQVAQIQGFDKQKLFMKTIERYWEQTLLKFLLSQKSDELRKSIHITNAQIEERYDWSRHQYFVEIVYLKTPEAADQLGQAGDKFDQTKDSISNQVLKSEPAQWVHIGDYPLAIEDKIVSLKPGQISKPIIYNNHWTVIRLLEMEDLEIESFEKSGPAIKEELIQRQLEENLSKWIEDIRKDAKVTINYDVLNQVDLHEIYDTNEKQGGSNEDR